MISRFGILVLLILSVLSAQAAPIYKWIDENGQVHFSDTPVGPSGEVEQTEMQTHFNSSAPMAADSPWTIQNQLDYLEQRRSRLAEERRQDKKLALEEKAIEQQQFSQTVPQVIVPPIVTAPYRVPWGYRYPYHPKAQQLPSDRASRLPSQMYDSPYHSSFRSTYDAIHRKATGSTYKPYSPHYPGHYPQGKSLPNYLHSGGRHRFR